jgi:hypothetical protein
MPKFAILNNNVVENLIICDTLEEAQTVGNAVQCESKTQPIVIGFIYNPETNTFSRPTTEDTNA